MAAAPNPEPNCRAPPMAVLAVAQPETVRRIADAASTARADPQRAPEAPGVVPTCWFFTSAAPSFAVRRTGLKSPLVRLAGFRALLLRDLGAMRAVQVCPALLDIIRAEGVALVHEISNLAG
ncbi:MAG TPA: hypothetical protein VLJ13_04030, partial [Brevundimonas sp.]|nr:hypothetical protein [Brevundimonas sp.]